MQNPVDEETALRELLDSIDTIGQYKDEIALQVTAQSVSSGTLHEACYLQEHPCNRSGIIICKMIGDIVAAEDFHGAHFTTIHNGKQVSVKSGDLIDVIKALFGEIKNIEGEGGNVRLFGLDYFKKFHDPHGAPLDLRIGSEYLTHGTVHLKNKDVPHPAVREMILNMTDEYFRAIRINPASDAK